MREHLQQAMSVTFNYPSSGCRNPMWISFWRFVLFALFPFAWAADADAQVNSLIDHFKRGMFIAHPMNSKWYPIEEVKLTCESLEIKAGVEGKEFIQAKLPLTETSWELDGREVLFKCTGPYEDCIKEYASERALFPPNAQYPKLTFFQKDYEYGGYSLILKNEKVGELFKSDFAGFLKQCPARK